MKSYIELEKIHFYAYHGVSEEERKVGNNYEVYIKVYTDITQAIATDNLLTTIDYGLLYEWIKEEMMQPSKLLEHVVGRIKKNILKNCPNITGGTIKISKIKPPIPGDIERASATISW